MNREDAVKGTGSESLFHEIEKLQSHLDAAFQKQFARSLPFTDELFDRWARAEKLNFGKGSSIYDSSYVFGQVQVGENTWVGPFTVIDGSGGLSIGNHCTIAAGVHIYSHDNVASTLTGGLSPIERNPVSIGNNTYIGPNAVIAKGVTIGSGCIIGVGSFVNRDVASNTIVAGQPARPIGTTRVEEGILITAYFNRNE